jgi:hypothetical protein
MRGGNQVGDDGQRAKNAARCQKNNDHRRGSGNGRGPYRERVSIAFFNLSQRGYAQEIKKMRISINAPSYRRPEQVLIFDYLPFCRLWVCESEVEAYKEHNPGRNIIAVPKGVQGNLCRIRNWILDHEFEAGADAVCLVDDDLGHLAYWETNKRIRIDGREFFPFLSRYTVMAKDLGARIWGVNVNNDKQVYREYTPFSLLGYIGGPFSVHLPNPIRYDEDLPLKEDYDMTLQHLNRFRRVLRLNKVYYMAKQGGSGTASGQKGGCSIYRNIEEEKRQLLALQKKWGPKIVKVDNCVRNHMTTKRKAFDVNPVISVPIPGV